MSCVEKYVCTICHNFAGSSFRAVFRHMSGHRYDPNLCIVCGIDSCNELYKNYDSYRSHVYRKHRQILVERSIEGDSSGSSGSIGTITNLTFQTEDEVTDCFVDQNPEPCANLKEIFSKKQAALFLLKTHEERKVTQTSLNGIVKDFHGLWQDSMENLKVCLK